jgi:hypothetical protein
LNVHPATSAHGVAKGANQLLQHQTVLPTIASAISLIFTRCPACSSIPHNPPLARAPPQEFRPYRSGESPQMIPACEQKQQARSRAVEWLVGND